MNITNFRHVGIVVKDIEKQLFFYKELLGMEVISSGIENGEFLENLLGLAGISASIYKLGTDDKIIVELLDFGNATKNLQEAKSLFENGITHFSLSVDNIAELYSKLKSNNVKFIHPPQVSQNGKFKVCFCKDYENNFIELVEVLK